MALFAPIGHAKLRGLTVLEALGPRGGALKIAGADLKRGVARLLLLAAGAGSKDDEVAGDRRPARAPEMFDRMRAAREAGEAAAAADRPLNACPFDRRAEAALAASWRIGWRDKAERLQLGRLERPPAPRRARLPYKDDEG